jgi:hypothetical protein
MPQPGSRLTRGRHHSGTSAAYSTSLSPLSREPTSMRSQSAVRSAVSAVHRAELAEPVELELD